MLSLDDNTNLYNIVAIKAEAEFMNVHFLSEVSVHNLESSQTIGFHIKMFTLQTRLGRSKIS